MIICIGESLIDFVPVEDSGAGHVPHGEAGSEPLPLYRPVAGGCPFNCAISAARLGGRVAFAGTISRDFFGDQIVERLKANGVAETMITRVDHPTTLAFVKKTAGGSARYAFFTNDAADRALTIDSLSHPLPASGILQMGSISIIPDPEGSAILQLAERAHGRRVIAFDPNIRESLVQDEDDYRGRIARALGVATLLKTSDEDLGWIYPDLDVEEAVSRVLGTGVSLVVLTRGAEGSTAYTADHEVTVPAIDVDVSDTIGAGDSFLAALLVWLDEHEVHSADAVAGLSEDELSDVLGFASRVSAITCTRVGADPPYRDEIGSE